jgi:ribosomal protein RSM22 (predicted rRNA methylase)
LAAVGLQIVLYFTYLAVRLCGPEGPGTGVFASKGVFPTLADFVLVEPSRSISQVAEHLLYNTSGVMYRRSLAEVHRSVRTAKLMFRLI